MRQYWKISQNGLMHQLIQKPRSELRGTLVCALLLSVLSICHRRAAVRPLTSYDSDSYDARSEVTSNISFFPLQN